MNVLLRAVTLSSITATFSYLPALAVTVDTVPVGNAGNAADSTGFGGVSRPYRIGRTEVTNSQYVDFLNAVDPAGTNSLQLYNSLMTGEPRGGINFSAGASLGSKYNAKSGRAFNPVVFVSWYDAIRLANWLHNGQGGSDTETGAYTLTGHTPTPGNASTIVRNFGATWLLPSEDQWYKAAYHKNDGITGNYWDYPTAADAVPYSDQPPGSSAPNPSTIANFYNDDGSANGYDDGYAVTGSMAIVAPQNYLTDVGAYATSLSSYDTLDQAGNVWEWNEALVSGGFRGARGGSWGGAPGAIAASYRTFFSPGFEQPDLGIRLVHVPEPRGAWLLGIGCVVMHWLGRPGHGASSTHPGWRVRRGTAS